MQWFKPIDERPYPPDGTVQTINYNGVPVVLIVVVCQPIYTRPEVDAHGVVLETCLPGNLVGFTEDGDCYWNAVGSSEWERIR